MLSQKNVDAILVSRDLCLRSAQCRAVTEHIIVETQETIKTSKALINRLNRSDHWAKPVLRRWQP
jgi:hypothetical protein